MADGMAETDTKLTELSKETASLYYSDGRVVGGGAELESDILSRTGYIPVKKGDVISSYIYRIHRYDKNLAYLAEDLLTSDGLLKIDYEVTDESCAYLRLVSLRTQVSPIYLNGKSLVQSMIDSALGTSVIVGGEYPYKAFNIREAKGDAVVLVKESLPYRDYINGAILGLWIKNPIEGATYYIPTFRYRQVSAEWNNTEYTQIAIAIKDANGATSYIQAVNDRTSATIKDGDIQIFDDADFFMIVDCSKAKMGSGSATTPNDYLRLDDIVLKKNNTIYLATMEGDNLEKIVETEKAYVREGITIPFKDEAYKLTKLDMPLIKGMVITDIGNAVSAVIGATGYNETITKAKLPFVIHTPITYIYSDDANSGEMRVEGLLYGLENNLNALDAKVEAIQKDTRNKGNAYISMPIPQLAIVNIRATALPTTKTADIQAE
jgi:hypothetical protein